MLKRITDLLLVVALEHVPGSWSVVIAVSLSSQSAIAGNIYACHQPNGSTEFRDFPCQAAVRPGPRKAKKGMDLRPVAEVSDMGQPDQALTEPMRRQETCGSGDIMDAPRFSANTSDPARVLVAQNRWADGSLSSGPSPRGSEAASNPHMFGTPTFAWLIDAVVGLSMLAFCAISVWHRSKRRRPKRGSPTASSCWMVLGVTPIASEEEIKQAYRRLASLYHPDRVGHLGPALRELAEEKMAEINRAYKIAVSFRFPHK